MVFGRLITQPAKRGGVKVKTGDFEKLQVHLAELIRDSEEMERSLGDLFVKLGKVGAREAAEKIRRLREQEGQKHQGLLSMRKQVITVLEEAGRKGAEEVEVYPWGVAIPEIPYVPREF